MRSVSEQTGSDLGENERVKQPLKEAELEKLTDNNLDKTKTLLKQESRIKANYQEIKEQETRNSKL